MDVKKSLQLFWNYVECSLVLIMLNLVLGHTILIPSQNFSLYVYHLQSACVFTRVLLTSSSVTASLWRPLEPSFLMCPLYFWQRLARECACSPRYDCPLHETTLRVTQWHHGNRIDYLQANYDISRRLTETSRFCDIQWLNRIQFAL